jgi:mono/diheme cytochrome c family protein
MNRATLNQIVDLAASILFLGMLLTAYILWVALPPQTHRLLTLWGVTRHQWGTVHAYLSFAFLAVVALHLALHWKWAVSVVRHRLHRSAASGKDVARSAVAAVFVLGVVLGLFAWAIQSGVQPLPESQLGEVHPSSPQPAKDDSETLASEGPSPEPTLSFEADILPILSEHCVDCHGPQTARGGFRVDERASWMGSERSTAWITPGDSDASPILAVLTGKRPIARPEVHRLPDRDVQLLRQWIDSGAPGL